MKKFTSLFALLSCLCVVSAQAVEINSLTIAGTFNNWSTTSHSFTNQGDNVWTCDLNFENAGNDVTFSMVVNEDQWVGFDKASLTAPLDKWLGTTGGGTYGNDFVFHNSLTGFKTYKITAKWDNTVTDVNEGWTFSIEGVDHYAYTVVGPASVFGSDWDTNNSDNEMTVNSNGYSFVLYKLISGIKSFDYKVVKEHSYTNGQYPGSGNWNCSIENYSPNVQYEVKIIFYPDQGGHECFVTPTKLDITDGTSFSSEGNFNVASASYSRNISNQWGTLCLPFKISTSNYLNNVTFYTLDRIENNAMYLNQLTGDINGGTPVLFKIDGDKLEISEDDVDVVTGTTTVNGSVSGCALHGSFTTQTVTNKYYILNNQFWYGTGQITINPYRAYIEGPAPVNGSENAPFRIEVDDTEGLQFVEQEDGTVKAYYDLQGRKLDGARKGLVIENGKIIMVK